MNLFERIKNIRKNNLQEKMKFPGGTGDIGFTAPKRGEKVQKRLTRADKLGTPDPFDPDYDKKVKKVDGRTKTGKAFQTPKKSDLKKLDKKPGSYRAPEGYFGKGDTKGQMNVKGMEKRAFKITKPSDIKLPKSFTDFQRNLQDYKDRDVPGGPRKSSTKSKTSGTSPTRQDVGMAPPDTPPKKKTLSATDYTKKINQQNPNRREFVGKPESGTPMRKGATSTPKNVAKDVQVGKMKNRIKELSAEREKMRSFTGKKDVKGMRKVNRQIKQYQKSIKSNPFVPTVYDPKNAPKKSTPVKQSNVTVNKTRGPYKKVGKKSISDIMKQNTIKGAKGPTSMKDVQLPQFSKTDSPSFKLSSKGQRVASKIPKAFRGKGFAKVGKAILKNPYVATAAAVGIGGYAAYKGIKGLLNKPKVRTLKTSDLKSKKIGSTVTHGRDDPKGKFKKGEPVRFDALGLGFTKKDGVQKKKPTYQDFQSGKYTFK